MRLSHFFIDRPVFAGVVAILITLIGAIAFPALPIAQYPEISPPTVNVTATYPGASAETLADTVADPIEEQINGVEDMLYMSSQSTGDGHVTITVTFKLGTDPNQAQVLVENRVATATPHLPSEVVASGVVVRKSSPDFLMAVHMYSPDGSLDQQYIANYVGLHIRDVLLRVPGVGDIGSRAARDYAMRIWIDPDRAAARDLTVEDVVNALSSHNVQVAAGTLGQPPQQHGASAYQLNIEALGRLSTPDEFGNIIVKTDSQGRVTRVSDVARVELGAADYTTNAYMNEHNAVALGILQQPGSNALQTAEAVRRTMDRLKQSFPAGLDYKVIYNPTEYVRASINEVEKTLFEALILVVLVVMIFLQTWRAAVIPIIAIPVSLIGTFAVMAAFGFSLNNLSLFGLVLAIGIVVDDAIVVVENVERHLRAGVTPREAAHTTMDEVGGALVAIALVLTAVFVPSAMIGGISGQFYKQFALTIATATLISLVVSLTLSPALAALIMKTHDHHRIPKPWERPFAAFADGFNRQFDRLSGGYSNLTRRVVRMVAIMLILYVGLLALTGWRLIATPRGFIPAQDQGQLLVAVNLPVGSALDRTDAIMRDVTHRLLSSPSTVAASVYAGVDATTNTTASNGGQVYLMLQPFAVRLAKHMTTPKVIADLRARLDSITGADIRIIQPPAVRGIGTTGGFKMIVEDQGGHGPQALEAATNDLVQAASHDPALASVFATYNTRTPRIYADIDRSKAEMLGVKDSEVFDTLQTYLGSSFVNDFNLFGRTFQVLAQADAPFRQDPAQIAELRTRSTSGAMVPLGSVVNIKRITGPYRVLRYNLFPGAEVQGDAAPGYSSGQAMAAMERLARQRLPAGYGFEWTELSYQEQLAGNTGTLVFALAVVFVFLLLAALYESVTLPFAVILIVPMCLLAAMLGINLRGMDNNILTQIGLIVLIGLAAKNAILIVEFARQGELEHGLERHEAAAEAARTRLRPILMTSFAFILGVAPLAFATGAGAEMRQALGVAVFFGMIGVTVFGLIFTPVFYVVSRAVAQRLPKPPPKPPEVPTTGGAPHAGDLTAEV
ncbi:MAG: multidrug efflux RND transporter permease subunit [Caulobacteraceae bacterium]|nr:multidrug efflux RND transporter permease subunit [Caulobacteraceae bacterium]